MFKGLEAGDTAVNFEPIVSLAKGKSKLVIVEGGAGESRSRLGFYGMTYDKQTFLPVTPGSFSGYQVMERSTRKFGFDEMMFDLDTMLRTGRQAKTAAVYVGGVYYAGQIVEPLDINYQLMQAMIARPQHSLYAEVVGYVNNAPKDAGAYGKSDLDKQRELVIQVLLAQLEVPA